MTAKQFESIKPGDIIAWNNNTRAIVIDPLICRKNRHAHPGETLTLQYIGGGCLETLNRYENTGIAWDQARLVKSSPQPEETSTIHRITDTIHEPLKITTPAELVYEPGNGTRFDIVLQDLTNGMLLVSIPNFKSAYWFRTQVSPGYVAEKLSLLPGDATYLADFINAQLGCPTQFAKPPVSQFARRPLPYAPGEPRNHPSDCDCSECTMPDLHR